MARLHVVHQGDTPKSIAARYGLSSWNDIYYANVNKQFRHRSKPNTVVVNEQWWIPESEYRILARQLASYMKIQRDTAEMFNKMSAGLDAEYATFNTNMMVIDTMSTILTCLVSMGATGIRAATMEGKALAQANKELLKSTKFLAVDVPYNMIKKSKEIEAGEANIDEENDKKSKEAKETLQKHLPGLLPDFIEILQGRGTMKVLKKIGYSTVDIAGEVLGILSPSWWGQKITGVRPGELHAKAKSEINKEKDRLLIMIGIKASNVMDSLKKYDRVA